MGLTRRRSRKPAARQGRHGEFRLAPQKFEAWRPAGAKGLHNAIFGTYNDRHDRGRGRHARRCRNVSTIFAAWHDPAARIFNVDLLAVLIAISLPWSTSATAIAALLWIAALIPTLELRPFLRSLQRPVSALPIALFALALAGHALVGRRVGRASLCGRPDRETLVLPLLLYHFQRSQPRPVGIRRPFWCHARC